METPTCNYTEVQRMEETETVSEGPEVDRGGYTSEGITKDDVSAEYEEKKKTQGYEVLLVAPVTRRRKKPLPVAIQEAVARQKATNTEVILTPFGHRTYRSMKDFMAAWAKYEKVNFLKYRTRHSLTAKAHNKIHDDRRVKKDKPLDDPRFLAALVPIPMCYAIKTLRCTHGCIQETRGDGERIQASTRYTACDARITAIARQLRTGGWVIQTVSEVIRHNHHCSQILFDSYATSSLIEEHHMYSDVKAMVQANALARNICDVFGMRTGEALTAQQLANFKRDHLGGQDAMENLRLLLARFSAFDGCEGLTIRNDAGEICGIVMQSAAQRLMFENYGDSLILDWTHNTNNLGYYLGALMVTSVTGRGASVLDFLCIEQTKAMMRKVFSHFVATNPGAATKPVSIVIDKDWAEWQILEEIFFESQVVLCQFHTASSHTHLKPSIARVGNEQQPIASAEDNTQPAPVAKTTTTTSERRATPQLVRATWPKDVVHLRTQYNPRALSFASTPSFGYCMCSTSCRKDTCRNAILHIYCAPNVCMYRGRCGNGLGLVESCKLQVATSPNGHGLTVVATENIECGVVIGEYVGELILEGPATMTATFNNGYRMQLTAKAEGAPRGRVYIDARRFGGIIRFMNHRCSGAEAEFRKVSNGRHQTVVAVTTRDVKAGEEVTVYYGDELWFQCGCGEVNCIHQSKSKNKSK